MGWEKMSEAGRAASDEVTHDGVSRRSVLAALGALGVIGIGGQSAAAARSSMQDPIQVIDVSADGHTKTGYQNLNTAVSNAPTQAAILLRGNVTVSETIDPKGTYLALIGLGGRNRGDADGMPCIRAGSGFSGSHLVDLSGIGSKWGFFQDVNLFGGGNVENLVRTGSSDNGGFHRCSFFGWQSSGIALDIGDGAFDTVLDDSHIDGDGTGGTGVYLHGGNEPKINRSLITRCANEGVLIDNIGRVGPRITNTSFRGHGQWGVKVQNNGVTRNIHIDRCQFENNPTAFAYAPEANNGAIASFQISRTHFNKSNDDSIKIENKVGNYILGPFNSFMQDVYLQGGGWSQDSAMLFNNNWLGGDLHDNLRDKPLAVFEPELGRHSFPYGGPSGSGVLSFADVRLYQEGGDLIAEDARGNTTTLS